MRNPTPASAGTAPVPYGNALTATLAGTAHTYLANGSTHTGSTRTWSVINQTCSLEHRNFYGRNQARPQGSRLIITVPMY